MSRTDYEKDGKYFWFGTIFLVVASIIAFSAIFWHFGKAEGFDSLRKLLYLAAVFIPVLIIDEAICWKYYQYFKKKFKRRYEEFGSPSFIKFTSYGPYRNAVAFGSYLAGIEEEEDQYLKKLLSYARYTYLAGMIVYIILLSI